MKHIVDIQLEVEGTEVIEEIISYRGVTILKNTPFMEKKTEYYIINSQDIHCSLKDVCKSIDKYKEREYA